MLLVALAVTIALLTLFGRSRRGGRRKQRVTWTAM